jgi:hypothetical protein
MTLGLGVDVADAIVAVGGIGEGVRVAGRVAVATGGIAVEVDTPAGAPQALNNSAVIATPRIELACVRCFIVFDPLQP